LAARFPVSSARWGFKYVSHYVWVKHKKAHGYWSQNQHELLLVGIQGNVVPPKDGAQWGSSVIDARAGRHSAKPETVLERIDAIWPNVPKIELNRRGRARPGWHTWGADVDDEGET
jgi:N6-adenosine-specific RNA methylase IME4